jgi:hypothetical protein
MIRLSSVGLLIVALIDLLAGAMLITSMLLSMVIDPYKGTALVLTIALLTSILIPRTRAILKAFLRRVVYGRLGGDEVEELELPEMNYFIAGDEEDVLIVGNDGTYWGRGFLKLSKTAPSMANIQTERNRMDTRMMFDAFIESAYNNKIPVQSVVSVSPIDEDEIIGNTPELEDTFPSQVSKMNKEQRQALIRSRMGVWQSRMIISTRSLSKPPSRIREIVEEVQSKVLQLKALFNASFPEYIVDKVAGRRELRRIASFMLTHSEGNDLIHDGGRLTCLTGKELTKLMTIPSIVTSYYPESFPYREFQLHPITESDIIIGAYMDDAGNPTNSAGLDSAQLRRGIAVFGEEEAQIDLTNVLLVDRIVKSSTPYMIFARDEKYRPLLSVFPEAVLIQLGKGIVINPLDAEGTDADQYITLILSVFENAFPLNDEQANMLFAILHDVYAESKTPTLAMLKEHVDDIMVSGRETLGRTRLLEGVLRVLTPLMTGNTAEALSGSSTIQFKSLLGENKLLTIIESKGMADTSALRFIQGMILAKMCALQASHQGPASVWGQRMLLLDEGELLFRQSSLKHIGSSNASSETISKWIDDLSKLGLGLHISTTKPGQANEQILGKMGTKIVHRITAKDDASIVAKYMNLDRRLTGRRSIETILSYDSASSLRNLAQNEALFIRPDMKKPFPIKMAHASIAGLASPPDSEISGRTRLIVRADDSSLGEAKTLLEVDYREEEERRLVVEILELLDDYPNFGRENIINSFDADEQPRIRSLLPKLENFRYVASRSVRIEGGNLRKVYRLTEKGRKGLQEWKRIDRENEIDHAPNLHEEHASAASAHSEEENDNQKTKPNAGLRPIFMGAIGGLKTAKSLYESEKYGPVIQQVSDTLKRFLKNLAKSIQIKTEVTEEDGLKDIVDHLGELGLPLPPDKSKIAWIGEQDHESKDGNKSINKEEAIKALQDSVSFLEQLSKIFHIE